MPDPTPPVPAQPPQEEKPLIKAIKAALGVSNAAPPPTSIEQVRQRMAAEQKARDAALKKADEEKKKREGQGGGPNMDRKVKRADEIIEDKPDPSTVPR
jgi:hypothetical protein